MFLKLAKFIIFSLICCFKLKKHSFKLFFIFSLNNYSAGYIETVKEKQAIEISYDHKQMKSEYSKVCRMECNLIN